MSSYVWMKVLETAPERYDRGLRWLSGGRIDAIYRRIAALAAAPGRRLLDLGCGTGGVALACAEAGARVVAIDRDAGMLRVARAKAAGRHLAGRLELIELGVAEIEDRFEPDSFDAVTACLVFSELIPEEQSYVLRTVHGRLRPEGLLVVADEVPAASRAGRFWHRLRRLPAALLTGLLTRATTRPVADLAARLRQAGFREVSEEGLGGGLAVVTGMR